VVPGLRWLDRVIGGVFDLALALPPLLLALVLIAGFGTSPLVMVITVALIFAPRTGRIVRGATQAVVTGDYVAAAQARGETVGFILVRELLPNIAATVIAEFALRMTWAVIFVAALSFLGLGAQPPSSDWGLMVAQARSFITVSPFGVLAPAIGIAILSVSLNLIADALASHLDPGSKKPVVSL
jgi:peptide/nickel transport system permease protein